MHHQTKSHRKVYHLEDNSLEIQAHPVSNLLQLPRSDTLSEDKLKRRRRRHRKVRLRDPEIEREVKLEKIMTRREGMWNSRFVNETIPDLFAPRVRPSNPRKERELMRRKPQSSLQMTQVELQKTKLPSLTVRADKKASLRKSMHKTIKMERLEELYPRKRDSFIKQAISKEISQNVKLEIQQYQQAQTIQKMAVVQEGHVVKETKQEPAQIILQLSLIALLHQKATKHTINAGYCQLLADLIEQAEQTHNHQVIELVTAEIEAIGTQRQTDTIISQYIQRRKRLIQQLSQEVQPEEQYDLYLKFQQTSLAVVELILKYRARWEDVYWEQFNRHVRIDFKHNSANYLTQMAAEVQLHSPATTADPFLIAPTARLRRALSHPASPQLTLRLRACELLLIEQDLVA